MTPYNYSASVGRALDAGAVDLLDPGAGGTVTVAPKGVGILVIDTTGARTLQAAAGVDVGSRVLAIVTAASVTVNGTAVGDGEYAEFLVTLNASGANQWSIVSTSDVAGLDARLTTAETDIGRLNTVPSLTVETDTATLTAAEVLTRWIDGTPTAAATYTLPTAALLVAAIAGVAVGDVIDLHINNMAASALTITLAAGTGGSADGTLTVAQNVIRRFVIRFTNVTAAAEAYTVYGLD